MTVAADRALFQPGGLDGAQRDAAVTAFIACQPTQDATRLLHRARTGRRTVLAVTPTAGLAAFLTAAPPTRTTTAAIAASNAGIYTWQDARSPALTGPFRPALTLTCRAVGTSPPLWTAACDVAPAPAALDLPGRFTTGAAATARQDAELRAVAEAYERHAAGRIPRPALTAATFDDLGPAAADPRDIICYRAWQREMFGDLAPFDPGQRRLWIRLHTAAGQPRWALADLIFYPLGDAASQLHTTATSSGMAAHTAPELAVRNAWHELLERDAFLRRWYARSSPPQVIPDIPLPGADPFTVDLSRRGWTLTLLALGSPGQPIIAAAARQGTRLCLGAAAHNDPQAAAGKAIREAWSAASEDDGQPAPPPEEIRTPADHGRLYFAGQHTEPAAFLLAGEPTIRLSQLTRPLPRPGPRTLVYRWPHEITRPFRVARVLDPRLIPITFGYGRDPLGRPDVARLVRASGRPVDRPLPPHPFA
jgi:hypothetical protein